MIRFMAIVGLLIVLSACGTDAHIEEPVERVTAAPIHLDVEVEGQVRAVQSTQLIVPGRQWTRRQVTWMLPDGEPVRAGDVIAKFSPEQSELELSQTLIDLQRNVIARA